MVTYAQMQKSAAILRKKYYKSRKLTLVLCDYAFETIKFILEMLYLGQPLMLMQSDLEEDFLKNITEKYSFDYIWRKRTEDENKSCQADRIDGEYMLSGSGGIGEIFRM